MSERIIKAFAHKVAEAGASGLGVGTAIQDLALEYRDDIAEAKAEGAREMAEKIIARMEEGRAMSAEYYRREFLPDKGGE